MRDPGFLRLGVSFSNSKNKSSPLYGITNTLHILIPVLLYSGFVLGAVCVHAQTPVHEIQRYDREPGFKYPVPENTYKPQPFKPREYVVYRTIGEIVVDGSIEESSWENADWTERFGHLMFKG